MRHPPQGPPVRIEAGPDSEDPIRTEREVRVVMMAGDPDLLAVYLVARNECDEARVECLSRLDRPEN